LKVRTGHNEDIERVCVCVTDHARPGYDNLDSDPSNPRRVETAAPYSTVDKATS